jgi:hypothetical protein
MTAGDTPRDVMLTDVAETYRPVGDVRVLRELVTGDEATFAISFDEGPGIHRLGAVGLRRRDGSWRRSAHFMGGHYRGVARPDRPGAVWSESGGWSGDGRSVLIGWPADPATTSVRITDPSGRSMTDTVDNGVVLFGYGAGFALTAARVDLLDATGRLLRSGGAHG